MSIACLLVGVMGGCQSPPSSATRPNGAPPRVLDPDGEWRFKAYRNYSPSPAASASARPASGPRR